MHPEPHPEWGDTTLSTTRADTPGGKVFATCDVTGKDLTLGDWYHKRGEDFDICGEEFGRRPAWEQRFYVAVTTLEALGDERSKYESDAPPHPVPFPPASRMRRNGFVRPFSTLQLVSWVATSILFLGFCAVEYPLVAVRFRPRICARARPRDRWMTAPPRMGWLARGRADACAFPIMRRAGSVACVCRAGLRRLHRRRGPPRYLRN